MSTTTNQVLSSSTLTGDNVVNDQGENIGEITEIMIDTNQGQVAYAVLKFGGFLGLGDKLFAIPWSALQLDTDNKSFVLNVDKETLKQAEGFDQDDWPDMANYEWSSRIYDHYEIPRYWE